MDYLKPERIVLSEKVSDAKQILKGEPIQPDFDYDNSCRIDKGGFVLLDFGREIVGGISIAVEAAEHDPEATKIRIVFGESVSEAMSTIGCKNATNNHTVRDFEEDVYKLSTGHYANTGFRFVKIEAVSGWIKVKSIAATPDIRPLDYVGSFKCSDELLNKIWDTGAYTVQLNTHDFIWDGVKRDRLVWAGDMHPEVSTFFAAFGYDDAIKNSLNLAVKSTKQGEWINGFTTYSVWWMIVQHDLFMYTGDLEYLKKQTDYIKDICDRLFEKIDGGYSFGKIESFVDWSSRDTESEIEGAKSVICIGLKKAKTIFDFLGISDYSEKCADYAEKAENDKCAVSVNRRIAAINILAGRNSDEDISSVSGNSAENMSCFFGFYVLLAKCMLGQYGECYDIIKKFWGGMLSVGATTFWEDFDIEWLKGAAPIDDVVPEGKIDIHGDYGKYCYKGFRHSLCHGWASGPTAVLTRYVLGASITKPGGSEIVIKPQLCDLDWAEGDFPTMYGAVHIKHIKENGKIKTQYTAPEEVKVILK